MKIIDRGIYMADVSIEKQIMILKSRKKILQNMKSSLNNINLDKLEDNLEEAKKSFSTGFTLNSKGAFDNDIEGLIDDTNTVEKQIKNVCNSIDRQIKEYDRKIRELRDLLSKNG